MGWRVEWFKGGRTPLVFGEMRNSKPQGTGWISIIGGRRQAIIPNRDQKQNDSEYSGSKKR